MDSDQRRNRRLPMEIEVELYRSDQPMCVVRTENLSCGGVLLILDNLELPPLGSQVQVRVVGMLGENETPPLVDARVIRHVTEGIAVQFSDEAFMPD